MITAKQARELFYYKSGKLYWRVNGSTPNVKRDQEAGTVNSEGYYQVKVGGSTYKVHRIIYLMEYGTLPEIIDHRNNNRLDNRIENLRPADSVQNMRNRSTPSTNTTGFKGVDIYRGKYRARITIDGKRETIGLFDTEKEAAAARDKLTEQHHGEFAKPS